MIIIRTINGQREEIELTREEMEKAFEIIRMDDLKEYFDEALKSFYPNVFGHQHLHDKLLADYVVEYRKYNSLEDENVFDLVMDKNKHLINSYKNVRE